VSANQDPDRAAQVADAYRRVVERVQAAALSAGRSADEVRIVAVTKTVSPYWIRAAHDAGARLFGENRVQEAQEKIEGWRGLNPPLPAEWHLIGHLQSNKARLAARLFDCVQSVDSVRLARELGRRAIELGRVLPVLLEVNIAGEASKSGFTPVGVADALGEITAVQGIDVRGLMTIAPIDAPGELARPWFARLRGLRDRLRSESGFPGLTELSMGMTNDFEAAIAEGSTMVRIGRAIFGERG